MKDNLITVLLWALGLFLIYAGIRGILAGLGLVAL
jgi:hypothetical protein